ncbi:MAG: SpoIIE family protein phosphatase [Candidatus Neomarinimicrobiota bacterium]
MILFYLQLSFILAEDKIKNINLQNIPSNNLLSVVSDNSNFVWIGTDQGLVRYDGIDIDVFRSNPFSSNSLSGNRVWFLDNYNTDTLIVITDNALHLYSKKNYKFEQYKINSRPTNYFKFKNEIWITTLSDGVYKLSKNKELIRFKFEPLDPFSISSSSFESIYGNKFSYDSNGDVWLATPSGLNKIQKNNSVRRYFRSNTNNALLSENILCVYYFDSGTLMIGTNKGLNYLDIANEKFSVETKLKDKSIINIDEVNGELLFFTNTGIYKKSNESIILYNTGNIFTSASSNNKTNLFWKKGSSKVSHNGKSIDLKNNVNDVYQLNNDFIISTNDGLMNVSSRKLIARKSDYRISKKQNIELIKFYGDDRNSKIKNINFNSYTYTDTDFWFISSEKVGRTNFNENTTEYFEYNPRNPNSFPKSASAIIQYDGFLWVGSYETGLYKYSLENLNLIKHYQFDISNQNSLQTSLVTDLLEKDNNLWIGSGGDGIFVYDSLSDGFTKKDIKSGLSSEIINKLFVIDGTLFAYTQQGLNYLTLGDAYFKSIDSDDGFNLSDFNGLTFSKVNNELFIDTKKGQFSIDLLQLSESASNSEVIVKKIVGTDSRNTEHLLAFTNNQVNVPSYITSIEISVSFPSLYKSKQNLYNYSYGSANEIESFTKKAGEKISIPKRGYSDKVLKIQSASLNSLQSQINFNYIPPWYFTWWAISLYSVCAIGVIYLFTTIRAKKLQQQMEESRKSEELEEARDLQLKLLAKDVPEIKNVEVETYIRTATEVGGDYYDFFELDDGTLIAACGDATGHGATSGMMVSITKAGLKGIQKRSPNEMLTDLNNIVKSVEIGRIRMSLNLLEFKNGHVNISSAAMPPVYHFSKKNNSVNEIELVGTPLGSFYDEEFDKYQVDFEDGDALVLMSDGLPEAPNHTGELLDYPAVKKCIKDNGSKSASGIKDSLIELSDNWLDGIQNPDDITLVIFKKKESGGIAKA